MFDEIDGVGRGSGKSEGESGGQRKRGRSAQVQIDEKYFVDWSTNKDLMGKFRYPCTSKRKLCAGKRGKREADRAELNKSITSHLSHFSSTFSCVHLAPYEQKMRRENEGKVTKRLALGRPMMTGAVFGSRSPSSAQKLTALHLRLGWE